MTENLPENLTRRPNLSVDVGLKDVDGGVGMQTVVDVPEPRSDMVRVDEGTVGVDEGTVGAKGGKGGEVSVKEREGGKEKIFFFGPSPLWSVKKWTEWLPILTKLGVHHGLLVPQLSTKRQLIRSLCSCATPQLLPFVFTDINLVIFFPLSSVNRGQTMVELQPIPAGSATVGADVPQANRLVAEADLQEARPQEVAGSNRDLTSKSGHSI